jgi:hypothetical protein
VILGAAFLVLVGLGFFAAGLMTGVTAWYWACVAACVAAAVLLALARRSMAAERGSESVGTVAGTAPGSAGTATSGAATSETSAPLSSPPSSPPSGAAMTSATGATAASVVGAAALADDPPVEEVEVTDLLVVVDLTDEVLVVDEHPRYHVASCRWLQGRSTIPLPMDEARADGFTPCGLCRPDRTLAGRARARRAGA